MTKPKGTNTLGSPQLYCPKCRKIYPIKILDVIEGCPKCFRLLKVRRVKNGNSRN